MLYLEDYLEIIEHLPQELRDRFTEMREMDLSVQNNIDSLEKRQNQLFAECRKSIQTTGEKSPANEAEFKNLMRDYYRTLEDADEKVHLANHMYDLVERYLRRLDTELYKFKCELEADHSGITSVLEKRSLELDAPQSSSHLNTSSLGSSSSGANLLQKENRYRPRGEKRRDSSASNSHEKRLALSSNIPAANPSVLTSALNSSSPAVAEVRNLVTPVVPTPQPSVTAVAAAAAAAAAAALQPSQSSGVSYNLGNSGAGTAIAAAASQAIAATQQMQQGRRTASLKASYEAINTGVHGHELSIGLAGAAHTALQAIQHDPANTKRQKKSVNRKWTNSSSNSSSSSTSLNQTNSSSAPVNSITSPNPETPPTADIVLPGDAIVDDADWTYDPNEPRYCVCNQVSYGEMVACDNEDCPFEWFHYNCVGITATPKGKWYCPQCTSAMRRRGSRKN